MEQKYGEFKMIPNAYWMDEFPTYPDNWVIEGLVCPYITVLSGQPKVRKSTLATHIALAVINQSQFLGKDINTRTNKVAWVGFDGGWHREIVTRCDGKAQNSILFQPGFTSLNQSDWIAFGDRLIQNQIGLLIVDNLYGYGDLQLNDHNEAKKVFNCLNLIVDRYGIPVLLIAHSPKGNGSASAAHSNIIKASARVLLELKGEAKSGIRTLTVIGNELAGEKLSIQINQTSTEFADGKARKNEKPPRDEIGLLLSQAQDFEKECPFENRKSASAAGRWMVERGFAKTSNYGRKRINMMLDSGLLKRDGVKGRIIPGPKLLY
jgi:hypothetical protein